MEEIIINGKRYSIHLVEKDGVYEYDSSICFSPGDFNKAHDKNKPDYLAGWENIIPKEYQEWVNELSEIVYKNLKPV